MPTRVERVGAAQNSTNARRPSLSRDSWVRRRWAFRRDCRSRAFASPDGATLSPTTPGISVPPSGLLKAGVRPERVGLQTTASLAFKGGTGRRTRPRSARAWHRLRRRHRRAAAAIPAPAGEAQKFAISRRRASVDRKTGVRLIRGLAFAAFIGVRRRVMVSRRPPGPRRAGLCGADALHRNLPQRSRSVARLRTDRRKAARHESRRRGDRVRIDRRSARHARRRSRLLSARAVMSKAGCLLDHGAPLLPPFPQRRLH